MKILTHNLLHCHVKNCVKNYPLQIKDAEIKTQETEFNPEFISRFLPRLDWNTLVAVSKEVIFVIEQEIGKMN